MKKTNYKYIIIMILFIPIILLGCNALYNKSNLETKTTEHSTVEEISLDYKVEKTILSKGYQLTNNKVEVIHKDGNLSLLLTLGLVECSNINVDKISKFNKEINIYTSRVLDNKKSEIVIPQIELKIENLNDRVKVEDMTFNIISTNYKPLTLKYNKNEIINMLCSKLGLITNTKPKVNIIKKNKEYLWDVKFEQAFEKNHPNNQIVNINARINESNKRIKICNRKEISKYIDEGIILDCNSKKYLTYKKIQKNNNNTYESLWLYNLKTGEKKQIYTTHNSIFTANISPNDNYISVIDNKKHLTDLFIIDIKNNVTKKITPSGYNHTWLVLWKNNFLYFLNNDKKSQMTLFKYDTSTNQSSNVCTEKLNVCNFDLQNEQFIYNEFNNENTNNPIYYSTNSINNLEIDTGFNCSFLNDELIIYMKKKQNQTLLYSYNIAKKTITKLSDLDIKKYFLKSKNTLYFIASHSKDSIYSLYKYDYDKSNIQQLSNVFTKDIHYNKCNNQFFINVIPHIAGVNSYKIYLLEDF